MHKPPITVYSPDNALSHPAQLLREIFQEFGNARELSWALFKRDLKAQFRQSMLGYAWMFFPPIATTLVWFLLNSSGVVRVADTGIPYPAFVMIGTLLWTAFLDSLMAPIKALNGAKSMMIKLKFPRIAPVLAGLGNTVLTSAVRMLLLIPIFLFVKIELSWTILLFPIGYLSLLLLGTAIGLFMTPIGLLYTDVSRAINVSGSFLMYATPVVYPIATEGFLSTVNRVNPVTYLLETSRALLGGSELLYLPQAYWISGLAVLLACLGWIILHISLPRIIERMGM